MPNPFADRPSTARQNAQSKAYADGAMDDLDKDSNCPEGVEPHIWQRLCMYRRQKVENENLVCYVFICLENHKDTDFLLKWFLLSKYFCTFIEM